MKDIDFDELDRAVSSVLNNKITTPPVDTVGVVAPAATPFSPPSQDVATETVASPPEAIATSSSPEPSTASFSSPAPGPTPSSVAEPRDTTSTPLMVKPRGKFMDVMHPSADMNPGTADMPLPPTRQSAPRTLQPLSTPLLSAHTQDDPVETTVDVDESKSLIGAEPALADDADVPMAPSTTPFEPKEPSVASGAMTSVSDVSETSESYVDPLDMPTVTPEGTPTDEARPTSPTPQTTPFLSDTKVDKRPLGAFGENEGAEEDVPPEEATAQTPPVVPLPRELQADVVEVESIQEADQTPVSMTPVSADTPFATSVPAPTVDDDGRVEGHPLFDTSTYHEPIAAVHTKKTAPWMIWLIGLGICLVIGAGVGYFLFTAGF